MSSGSLSDRLGDRATLRAQTIARYDVLGGPPNRQLLEIVKLAATICGTELASLNILTETKQVQVATHGFVGGICDLEDSLCAERFEDAAQPAIVHDARRDRRLRDKAFVSGELGNVRFYASHALVTPGGVAIGTLCVFDLIPRELDAAQADALGTLAERVVDVLELGLRTQELATSNERLAGFAGRVSHDLKSPLASVSMSLGLLRERLVGETGGPGDVGGPGEVGSRGAEVDWLLDRAARGAERMAVLIDQMLAYASIGGGVGSEPVDLGAVLTDVLADLDGELGEVRVERGPLPVVTGDPVQLNSLLQNLVHNSVKYRHPERPAWVRVQCVGEPEGLTLQVIDNGIGVPPEDRERVFEPRVRLADDDSGSGIGLDTCRRIAEAHEGSIGMTGTDGGGTTVWVRLPGDHPA